MNNIKIDKSQLLSNFLGISIGAGLVISSLILSLGLLIYGFANRYQIVAGATAREVAAFKLDKMSGKVWLIALGPGSVVQIAVDEKIGKF